MSFALKLTKLSKLVLTGLLSEFAFVNVCELSIFYLVYLFYSFRNSTLMSL